MEERAARLRIAPLVVAFAAGVVTAWIVATARRPDGDPPRGDGVAVVSNDAGPGLPSGASPAASLQDAGPERPGDDGGSPSGDAAQSSPRLPGRGALRFREVWAYLLPGDESRWSDEAPISDLALFDFGLDAAGKLKGKPNLKAIERAARRGIRTHAVVASSGNSTLLHLALSPHYGVRRVLLESIAALPGKHGVNGVQLDLEDARPEERADLVSFVRDLRAALPAGTILSLALPARTRDTAGAFVYADFAQAADRFFIMGYDQHWQGGPPGPVSALAWHRQVLEYAGSRLPRERVVAGLPFYGRLWQLDAVARAVKSPAAEDIARKEGVEVRRDPARANTFTFRTEVRVECWFDDAESLRAKLASALEQGFQNVGFWRIGQEDPRVWETIELEKPPR